MTPSKLVVGDEPMRLLWNRLALHLDELAAPQRLPHGFLEATCRQFCDEGFDLSEDVFTCVAKPTGRAGKDVLALTITGAFNRYATRAAKDALGVVSH